MLTTETKSQLRIATSGIRNWLREFDSDWQERQYGDILPIAVVHLLGQISTNGYVVDVPQAEDKRPLSIAVLTSGQAQYGASLVLDRLSPEFKECHLTVDQGLRGTVFSWMATREDPGLPFFSPGWKGDYAVNFPRFDLPLWDVADTSAREKKRLLETMCQAQVDGAATVRQILLQREGYPFPIQYQQLRHPLYMTSLSMYPFPDDNTPMVYEMDSLRDLQ